MDYGKFCTILLFLVFCISCNSQQKEINSAPIKQDTFSGPKQITRTLAQDQHGNIWMAAFDGIFRYDGTQFTNMTIGVSSARFFSVLEDSKGNMWFGSIGSGVYRYDGASFLNYTTVDGLANNEIVCIYEDSNGHIWFGSNGAASRYDGKIFRNYLLENDTMFEDKTGYTIPNLQRPTNEVNSIIEDSTGKMWFATRGFSYVYDGSAFSTVSHQGNSFTNVRWIIEDNQSNIWLGGNDGLWRYDGDTYTNITENFVGYIYEDKKGNIWTSSQKRDSGKWTLTRYDQQLLPIKHQNITEIESAPDYNQGMIFGILQGADGLIWVGALDGVYIYKGEGLINFKHIN